VTPQRTSLRVEEVREPSGEVEDAVRHLLPQLSRGAPGLVRQDLAEIVGSDTTRLLLARDLRDGTVHGMLTLALFRVPTGVRAWIEDVVVDEAARGRGAGELLTREAVRIATDAGARTVDLTSSPAREAANRLYQRLGFERRETSVYRLSTMP
jgi:ribosomal protein S18 acetylase RimI-like enzyme